jgi:negative regulator of flagellin synthesis FlgM
MSIDLSLVAGGAVNRATGRTADHSAMSGQSAQGSARRDTAPVRTSRPSDKVEISERARLLSRMAELPPIRAELVARVKAEIAAGTYDDKNSPAFADKLDGAARGLLADLR